MLEIVLAALLPGILTDRRVRVIQGDYGDCKEGFRLFAVPNSRAAGGDTAALRDIPRRTRLRVLRVRHIAASLVPRRNDKKHENSSMDGCCKRRIEEVHAVNGKLHNKQEDAQYADD